MTRREKLIQKILCGRDISYKDAENILLNLGFELDISGSHHVFRKAGYQKTVCIKRRPQLLAYQINDLREVLKDHGH